MGGLALLAFQRGEDSEEAMLGAMMTAEFQAAVVAFIRSWAKR